MHNLINYCAQWVSRTWVNDNVINYSPTCPCPRNLSPVHETATGHHYLRVPIFRPLPCPIAMAQFKKGVVTHQPGPEHLHGIDNCFPLIIFPTRSFTVLYSDIWRQNGQKLAYDAVTLEAPSALCSFCEAYCFIWTSLFMRPTTIVIK